MRKKNACGARMAQWSRTTKNPEVRTGPLDHPFTYSLTYSALLALLALPAALNCSLVHSLPSRQETAGLDVSI